MTKEEGIVRGVVRIEYETCSLKTRKDTMVTNLTWVTIVYLGSLLRLATDTFLR